MKSPKSKFSVLFICLLHLAVGTNAFAQNTDDAKLKKYVNELEAKYKKTQQLKREIDLALFKVEGDAPNIDSNKRKELKAKSEDLAATLKAMKKQFEEIAAKRQYAQAASAKKNSAYKKSAGVDEELKAKMAHYLAALKEIDAMLKLKKGNEKGQKELMAKRKDIIAAMTNIKTAYANEYKKKASSYSKKKPSQPGPKDSRYEHPEIKHARAQLGHLKQAYSHLREAKMEELANAVALRADKIAAAIKDYEKQREATAAKAKEEALRKAEIERKKLASKKAGKPSAKYSNGFEKEVMGAIRELNAAVKQLRNEVEQIKKN